jgi:phenylacetate-CoA ligase
MRGEAIYDRSPIALQNIAVSIKGWQFHKARYRSRWFVETARALEENERLSLAALRELQLREFRAFAEHCYNRSPYYRALWEARKIHPRDIRCLDDIRLAPTVPKQNLRARTAEFFTESDRRGMIEMHTSGTTGSPLTVFYSGEDLARRHAFLERCRRWAGVRVGQKRATFTGRNIVPPNQKKPPFWRHNRPGRQMLFSPYHLATENLPAYVEALADFQPEIIDGYPSAIHVVAEFILRSGIAGSIRPRAVLVSAETVLEHQRRSIEAAFEAKLYNQYASSEGAPFVSECAKGRLHVHLDSGVIEVLDAKGNPAGPGQMGQMVVTSFTTHVVPLLRFEIGDTAIAASDPRPCECGLPFPTLDAIVGRVDDILYTPDRGYVGRLDTVFKSVPGSIVEAQIVQSSQDTIVLRLVPDKSRYAPAHADAIVKEMRKRLGQMIKIRVEEVDAIPRSANGKMRPVVNLCSDALPSSFRYAGASARGIVRDADST